MNLFKKWLIISGAAVAGLFGCQLFKAPTIKPAPIVTAITPSPTPTTKKPTDAPIIGLGAITGASLDENAWITYAVQMANRVLSSDCFENQVNISKYTETNGLTNAQIYNVLTADPLTIKVDVFKGSWVDDYWNRKEGYELEPGTVHINRHFMSGPKFIASLILHEVAHVKGFTHYGVKSTSVPYGQNEVWDVCSLEVGIE